MFQELQNAVFNGGTLDQLNSMLKALFLGKSSAHDFRLDQEIALAVPDSTWTKVNFVALNVNNTQGAYLDEFTLPEEEAGYWYLKAKVFWDNTAASLASHRRQIRLVADSAVPRVIAVSEVIFDNSLGDLTIAQPQSVEDIEVVAGPETKIWVEVFQNSGDTINLLIPSYTTGLPSLSGHFFSAT